jgi:hypothetical protein
MRGRHPILLCCLALAAFSSAAAGPHRLTERSVRAFVARREALWNRRDFVGFFALTAPEAVFTTERKKPDGTVSTERELAAESRRSAERTFATLDQFRETSIVDRIDMTAGLEPSLTPVIK